MHAEKIKQDVLFFSGNDDHFIPVKRHKRQIEALVNAKSITDRIFTKENHAQNHCRIGNIGLALDTNVSPDSFPLRFKMQVKACFTAHIQKKHIISWMIIEIATGVVDVRSM